MWMICMERRHFLVSSSICFSGLLVWLFPWLTTQLQVNGAMCGVTVSMSAFLACHQCYCVGSSLAWGLNLQTVVCGIF